MKQVLLITGSSGIAAATARMWAAEDPVFVVGIHKKERRSLTAELGDSGFAVADVRDASAGTGSIRGQIMRATRWLSKLTFLGLLRLPPCVFFCAKLQMKRASEENL